ncbi:MAG: hypothetical protein IPL99_04720 [Candidatus Competibacteraceae bacterium]|nr:hypothetical protein [Candidatus Competibacteraceae bacterium]
MKSVYNKLNGVEPSACLALVRTSAEQVAALITEVGGARSGLLAGYRDKILDGNIASLRRAAQRPRHCLVRRW